MEGVFLFLFTSGFTGLFEGKSSDCNPLLIADMSNPSAGEWEMQLNARLIKDPSRRERERERGHVGIPKVGNGATE